jgi:hypothetical protein
VRRTTWLPNGVCVASDARADAAQAAIGVCVLGGVRAQASEEGGFAHLAEHLLFESSGVERDAAFAQGTLNAYTGREHIALTGIVPAREAPRLIECSARALVAARFDDAALAAERTRIERERFDSFASVQDEVEQRLVETIWPDHPIARALLGTPDDLARASVAALENFWRRVLRANAVFVFGAGALDHAALERAAHALAHLPSGAAPAWGATPRFHAGARREYRAAPGANGEAPRDRVLWVLPAPLRQARDAFALLSNLIARPDGVLHRRLGDAAALRSHILRYSDAGAFALELETPSGALRESAAEAQAWLDEIARDGLSIEQFSAAQGALAVQGNEASHSLNEMLEVLALQTMQATRAKVSPVSRESVNRLLGETWPMRARLRWSNE